MLQWLRVRRLNRWRRSSVHSIFYLIFFEFVVIHLNYVTSVFGAVTYVYKALLVAVMRWSASCGYLCWIYVQWRTEWTFSNSTEWVCFFNKTEGSGQSYFWQNSNIIVPNVLRVLLDKNEVVNWMSGLNYVKLILSVNRWQYMDCRWVSACYLWTGCCSQLMSLSADWHSVHVAALLLFTVLMWMTLRLMSLY